MKRVVITAFAIAGLAACDSEDEYQQAREHSDQIVDSGRRPHVQDGARPEPSEDGGITDAATDDASAEDAATEDAAKEDAEAEDAEVTDATLEDAALEDAGPEDAETEDATPEDASPEDATLEDASVTEEICNGIDDDQDGLTDEELDNVCGGCGALGDDGCQAWIFDFTLDENGEVALNQGSGLGSAVSSIRTFENEDLNCQITTSQVTDEDSLGALTIHAGEDSFFMVPNYNAASGSILYSASNAPSSTLYSPGETFSISVPETSRFHAFNLELQSPEAMEGFSNDNLQQIISQIQGGSVATLRWDPDAEAQWSLYVGGSRTIFASELANHSYRATEFYVLQALLQDDGECRLDVLQDLPESSARVQFSKTRAVRKLQGPNVIEFVTGQTVSASALSSGSTPTEVDDDAFNIMTPNPAAPTPALGELIAWLNLPNPGQGGGALTITLSAQNAGVRQSVVCAVKDPSQGEVSWPTELVPFKDAKATLQGTLVLRFTETDIPMQGDQGNFTKSTSVQFNLAL